VVFLGDQGTGKSTVAGALYARGHRLIADDVVALDSGDRTPILSPAFPRLKLWPDAAGFLGERFEDLPRLHPSYEKRAYSAARGFSTEAVALRRIYVLTRGPRCAIEQLDRQNALIELIRNTYT